MIIDKDINIEITGYNIRFYQDEYPDIKKGDIITLNQIRDISPRSTIDVECICSNYGCGNKYFRKRRNIYTKTTYCSDKCRGESVKTSNLIIRKKEIANRFKSRIDNGKSIKYNDIKEDDPQLLHAMDKYYPINEVCRDLGIPEEELISKYGLTRNINKRNLTEEEIFERLNHLKSIGRLTTSAMRTEFDDLRLEQSIKKVYGSVEECFEVLGFQRDIYSNDVLIMMGREFEELFKNILKDLKINFHYQRPLENGFIPDFHLYNENIIIDTKLSSWTTSIVDDIHKYSEHCNRLIFVYLREGSTIPQYNDKVKIVSVYDYIKKLEIHKRNYYITKLKKILSYHP